MADESSSRLRLTINAFTEAVRSVRTLDTEYREDEDEAAFDAKLALLGLDTGLVAPRFWGLAILTHAPSISDSADVGELLDGLESINALARAAQIVETVQRDGVAAGQGAAESLAGELRMWIEAGLKHSAIQGALAAYRENPRILNEIKEGLEKI